MLKRAVVFIVFSAVLASAQRTATPRRQAVTQATFCSASLKREMHYSVMLPAGYQQGNRHYPVLYLLHGLYGNHMDWVSRTRLTQYAEALPVIIVMPDAGDSWYTNSASVSEDKYEDYILKDLIAEVDAKYRTINARHGRAVAGLSMGGYAAMKFALRRPDLFAMAGSLSGAFNAPLDADETPEYRDQLIKVFGERGSRTRSENDIFHLVELANPASLPYLFVTCGTADQFLSTNRKFAAALQAKKIAYEYHEMPGGHSWVYWDGHIRDFMVRLSDKTTPEWVGRRGLR